MPGFYIKKVMATGLNKRDSFVDLISGLNIIHGLSDSGKTIVAEIINYAFGSEKLPFSPDVTGYTDIQVILQSNKGETKLCRSLVKNKNQILVSSDEIGIKDGWYPINYRNSEVSINDIILYLLGFNSIPEVAKNKYSDKIRLTWRTLLQTLYLDKDAIVASGSIAKPENTSAQTPLLSTLLYFIYGKDFSNQDPKEAAESRKEKIRFVEEFTNTRIVEIKKRSEILSKRLIEFDGKDLETQIKEVSSALEGTEKDIKQIITKRNEITSSIIACNEKISEGSVLQSRYSMLREQYQADIQRLNLIVEGERSLFEGQEPSKCPFCDSQVTPKVKMPILEASKAELSRTLQLLNELVTTEQKMSLDLQYQADNKNKLETEKKELDLTLKKKLEPRVAQLEKTIKEYGEYLQLKGELDAMGKVEEELKKAIKDIPIKTGDAPVYHPKEFFTEEFFNQMASNISSILRECHYTDFQDAVFDEPSFDLKLDNCDKFNIHGQGFCAFFNSVVGLSFQKLFKEIAKYKPGLLIIDNPLLGLSVDSQNEENVKNGFYQYLINHQNYGQTIILQNSEKYELPKLDYKGHGVNVIFFSKSDEGRYGFLLDYRK